MISTRWTAAAGNKPVRRHWILLVALAAMTVSAFLYFSPLFEVAGEVYDVENSVTSSLLESSMETRFAAPGAKPTVQRYAELKERVAAATTKIGKNYDSTYNKANVVRNATSWFTPRKICKDSCCAETVAVSLQPDDRQIINTLDGLDLADIRLQHYRNPPHIKFQGNILNETMLPCLQPGTIIQLENHMKILHYFFLKVRKKITVPYILMTTKSDGSSPLTKGPELATDNFLIRWYGTNPQESRRMPSDPKQKFAPLPLGLSKHYDQDKFLSQYLRMTNYTNPFLDKSRWTSLQGGWRSVTVGKDATTGQNETAGGNLTTGGNETVWRYVPGRNVTADDMFVKFGVNRLSKRRQVIVDGLCGDKRVPPGRASCGKSWINPHEIYAQASTYLFGVSPPGAGYDCYRTYELLLMGVIPIVEERHPLSDELFRDLPVVQVSNMFDASPTYSGRIVRAAQEYIESDEFRYGSFDKGWERLFLRYWRRRILRDAGREKDILMDEHGREYYQAWRYTPMNKVPVLCSKEENC
uniref:Uncharacterized protein n=1 Tax=Odontella aurita TaxID=265563 RepID=A0A7S4I1X6_9STRA|mmetsp:Transcript_18732/g.54077  ORF Transcript_18732/g.54077 Transcript_18732/m.54077 type:complete len:527 (+) Transcript_18732:32-1612(+)